jgi:hypothetical protein
MSKATGQPFGDAFIVNTPALDQISNAAYRNQQMQQTMMARHSQMMDNIIMRSASKIRAADEPEFHKAFNQYNDASRQMYFDPKAKRDPSYFNQLRKQRDDALENVYSTINASNEQTARLKNLNDIFKKHPEMAKAEYGELSAAAASLPASQLKNYQYKGQNVDLTNLDNFIDKDVSNYDMNKAVNTAFGKPVGLGKFQDTPIDKYSSTRTEKMFGATPSAMKTNLMSEFAGRRTAGNAAIAYGKTISPEEIKKTDDEFKAATGKFSELGISEPPDISVKDPNNYIDVAATYLTQRKFLDTPISMGTPKTVPLGEEKHKDRMAEINQRLLNSEKLASYKKRIGATDNSFGNNPIEGILNHIESNKGGVSPYHTADGQTINTRVINNPPPELKKVFEVKNGIHTYQPNEFWIADNGDYIGTFWQTDDGVPITYKKDNGETGHILSEKIPSVRLSREDVGIGLGKQILTREQNAKIITNKYKSAPPKTVNVGGKQVPEGLFNIKK